MRTIVRSVVFGAVITVTAWRATADTRKVIVLPLEGDADAAQRAGLDTEIIKLARAGGGDVSAGNTTFAETAAAVGCDPAVPACGETVIATLGVDEIVYGTASTAGGQTTIAVTRLPKGGPARSQTTMIRTTESADHADGGLGPLFGGPVLTDTLGSGLGPGSAAGSAATRGSFFDTTDRKLGVGLVAGGGVAILIGVVLWASESTLQGQINIAPTSTHTDLVNLVAKEDQASSYAWGGNILVFVGLAVGAVGGYYLWRDHKARATATVAPAEHGTGMTLVVGGRW